MRKKIATAWVCFCLCLAALTTTGTTSAHNHQKNISNLANANEMMIEGESANHDKGSHATVEKQSKNKEPKSKGTNRQQKSNQKTIVVRRVTYYYPTGQKTATGHSDKGRKRIVSLSPDLLKKIPYHSKVEIEGYGIFYVEDRTANHIRSTADILVPRGTKIKNGKNVTIRVIK